MEDDIRTVHLSVADLEVIEEALLARRKELGRRRETLDQCDPAQRAVMDVIDQDIWSGNDLISRLQNLVSALPGKPAMVLRVETA